MGRLFEYNRFNNDEDINKEASAYKHKEFMQKSQSPQTKQSASKYETVQCPAYSELYPETDIQPKEDTMKRTKSTMKSVEVAIKKYHQLSKFLIQNQDEEKDDCEIIATAAAPKRPKVYDCMRDFLRKKFFQHNVSEESEAAEYDGADYVTMMDSYDIKDIDRENKNDDDDEDDECCLLVVGPSQQDESRCWPNNEVYAEEVYEVDSDTGIKDCCQLLASGGGSPKVEKCVKTPKRKSLELPAELREAPWFQPNISSKAVTERLTKEAPGAFIIRQSASVKHGNFILCLRMETKVKKFVILGSPRCYKLKGAKKEFSSLKALVTHHSVMAEQLPVTLTLPRTIDEKPSHRYLDDFDTFESLQILGILKFLQSKNLEFP